jgi:hypothetical protein
VRVINDSTHKICSSCLDELKNWKSVWFTAILAVVEVSDAIYLFMASYPGQYKVLSSKEEIDREFNRLIRE